jgi:hypothetical protein
MKPFAKIALALVLGAGLMRADEGGPVTVHLNDVPLAEALKEIEKATGHRFVVTPAQVEGRRVTFVRRGTPEEILGAFSATLEQAHRLAIVGGGTEHRLNEFNPAQAAHARPAPRGRKLSVTVVEGTVALVGDRGRVTVRAGEASSVFAGSLPASPVPRDTSTVAAWRFNDVSGAQGLEARIPLPELECRLVGWAPDGRPIVEYEIEGEKRTTIFGEFDTNGAERERLIIEGDGSGYTLEIPLKLRLKLNRGSK